MAEQAYLKLDEAPTMSYQSPQCDACLIDLDSDDGWLCPSCGTSWSHDASDGEAGELYEAWSGEELPGDAVHWDDAWSTDHATKARRERWT